MKLSERIQLGLMAEEELIANGSTAFLEEGARIAELPVNAYGRAKRGDQGSQAVRRPTGPHGEVSRNGGGQ
jgi:hypothetical protein